MRMRFVGVREEVDEEEELFLLLDLLVLDIVYLLAGCCA